MPTNGQVVKIAHYSRLKFNSLTNKDGATIYYVKEPDGTIKQYIGSTHVVSDVSNKTDLKSNTDNRSVKTIPNDYNAKFDIKGLKSNTTLGITGQGSYSALLGIRGWTDSSGGNSHEFALTGNGEIYHRHGATTTWSAWNTLAKQSWVTANTRSNTWTPTKSEIDTALKGAGTNSIQLGQNATAEGDYSAALGYSSYASGEYSAALGPESTAEGDRSTALGIGTTAEGKESTALGAGSIATGLYSIALGSGAIATGENSIAIGRGTKVIEDDVVDFGVGSQVRVNETPRSARDAVSKTYLENNTRSNTWTPAIGDLPTGTTGTTVALGKHTHSAAATNSAGFMSAADKTKLDGLVTNATHTGDVTGSVALTIANNKVTNAKLADMPTARIKGRVSSNTGDPEDLTQAQVRLFLGLGSSAYVATSSFRSNNWTPTWDQVSGKPTWINGSKLDLNQSDVGLGNVENKSSATIRSEITAANIPSLNASKITAGTLPVSRGGTGLTSLTDGAFMMGVGAGVTMQGNSSGSRVSGIKYFTGLDLNGDLNFASDERVKNKIKKIDISELSNIVDNVDIWNYNYINSDVSKIGLMAQDLEESSGDLTDLFVNTEDYNEEFELENFKSIKQDKLVYILWGALQKANERIDKLEQLIKEER